MDFPLFHLDWAGNRMLIAVIAVLHVLVNHSMAVGAMPLIALVQWWGYRTADPRWDRLAYRLLGVCFIVTTTVGALTGVGIWLSASLVNPHAIGSLIRVFFWAWFTEWIVFITEVCLILAYFLTWKSWGERRKGQHIVFGCALALASWLTMAIIVAILGFMMDPGSWAERRSFWTGVLNPIYLPQLCFRTPLAMVMAGLLALLLIPFFTARDAFRRRALRFVGVWTLAWSAPCIVGAGFYWLAIPDAMRSNMPVALATQAFQTWHTAVAQILTVAAAAILIISLWAVIKPGWLPRPATAVPFLLMFVLLGYFERVREFVRKPAVIENYMYANGIEIDKYPLLREEGVLAHATYASHRTVTPENELEAGRDMFIIACSRCHTTTGVNGVVNKLTTMYGREPWSREIVLTNIRTLHNVRPFMPPAPGTDAELSALAAYLVSLQANPVPVGGAQNEGVKTPVTTQPAVTLRPTALGEG
ncbi:MAG TPA: cytochrome c [Phycisphaerae bacterium]|nr:cytochrome c [Phycisphaerae bacterium]HOJ72569.1 cytochrome c [Phycisphaerae bacterium]HOM49770.1 cytochrome c [Phycisphaerae bacterium]HON66769.1 cytochrome c [Phycisphaerae bacterium]HOQ85526.1 cytochrome c [Phycisphaerae bacterium]